MDKKMTLLITGGDSYTDTEFHLYKKHNIDAWPTLLANKMNCDLIDTAKGGSGNRNIVNSIIDAIVDNIDKEIVVAVAWSEVHRLSYIDDTVIDHPVFLFSEDEFKVTQTYETYGSGLKEYFRFLEPHRQQIVKAITKMQSKKEKTNEENIIDLNSRIVISAFRNIFLLQNFCSSHNIKLYHTHTFDSFGYDNRLGKEIYGDYDVDNKVIDKIKTNIYYHLVKTDKNYMGSDNNLYEFLEKNQAFITDNWHPNQYGHQLIAQLFNHFITTGELHESLLQPNPN